MCELLSTALMRKSIFALGVEFDNLKDRIHYSALMNNITLRQIRTFLAVVDTGSFKRAAELVHLSQPAVTAHVQQLESELGIALLDRTTRRVKITPAGGRFRIRSEHALAELNAVAAELQEEAEIQHGRVVVACVPTIAARQLPQVLVRFSARYPGISVRVRDVVAVDLYAQLDQEFVDFGIGPNPKNRSDFVFRQIVKDPYVAVVAKNHPWVGRKSVSLKELADAPFLTMLTGSSVRTTLEDAMRAHGLKINPLHEVQHHHTLGGMVEAGLGVTALPSMAVSMLSQPLLRSLPIFPAISRVIGVLTLRGRRLSPAAEALVQVFEDIVKERRLQAAKN